MLLIDEAHSLGVTGTGAFQGHGSVAGTALAGHPNVIVTATLSKALGSQGGAVLGIRPAARTPRQPGPELHLRHRPGAGLGRSGPRRGADHPGRTLAGGSRPEATLRRWPPGSRPALQRRGAAVERSGGGRPVHRHAVRRMRHWRRPEAARAAGVRIGCFRPPSVPDGISRLRLTARATLTPEEIDDSCAVLRGILEELP